MMMYEHSIKAGVARLTIHGAWYCDARPGGAYVASGWQPVQTKDGPRYEVDLNGYVFHVNDPLLFPRLSFDGTRVLGINGRTDYVEEYAGGRWTTKTYQACGTSSVIYDSRGRIHASTCAAPYGSQGYRYVEAGSDRLIACADTYHDPVSGLFEYTTLPSGYVIGQGPDDNDAFLFDPLDRSYRSLIPGNARFIRATQDGDRVSVAAWVPSGNTSKACLVWASMQDLLKLPKRGSPKGPFKDEPLVTIGDLKTPNHEVRVQVFGGPGFRMNLGPQHDRDPNAAPSGAFVTLDHDPESAYQDQLAYARGHRVPFYQYLDKRDSRWTFNRVRREEGVRVVPLIKAYPDTDLSKIAAESRMFDQHGIEHGVVLPFYRQMIGHGPEMNWKMADVVRQVKVVWDTIVAPTKTCRHALGFHQHRESPVTGYIDGIDSREDLRQLAQAVFRAAASYVPPKPTPPKSEKPIPPDPPVVEPPVEPEPPAPRTRLERGEVLFPGDKVYSPDGQTWLHLQAEDGRLVLYHRDPSSTIRALWAADYPARTDVACAVLQSDSNFVVYGLDDEPIWDTQTVGRGIEALRVEAGRVVLVNAHDQPIWQLPPVESKPAKDVLWFGKVISALWRIFR